MAWGNPNRLSDSDALRFQWPSIVHEWERGLLEFGRAVCFPRDDAGTLRKVVERRNTRVVVMRGTKDRVIANSTMRAFLGQYGDRISFIDLEGVGHDPFEEDTDQFISKLEQWMSEDS